MGPDELRQEVERYPWYHTLDLGNGVVTPGMFDHRGTESRHLLPDDLSGLRCLDVGTMDGYWAFAMERRGASEVVAVDMPDNPEGLDWPASLRPTVVKTVDETKTARFELVRGALGSSVRRELRSVYDLDVDLGTFDFVFCGDLLVHLKDPATALERIRRVCGASAVICNPTKEQFPFRRRPLAQFDGIDEFEWWLPNQAALERMVLAAGFSRVEAGRRFALATTSGGPWKGRRSVVRGYVA
ncbi:MAG TPA: class I SAM-dependent methyltransferase [Acidimicrobiales bacterium]|nr:class I SAM-dependent methyltransferase [Acidimicrobiales bacterium]